MKKEFYGILWLKGKPEDIDNWLSGEGEYFARQFYLEEEDEEAPEDLRMSKELDGFTPWFENKPNEEGVVIRHYSLGSSYWTENDEPLDLDKINEMADLIDQLAYCFISVDKDDYDENGDDATSFTRSCEDSVEDEEE